MTRLIQPRNQPAEPEPQPSQQIRPVASPVIGYRSWSVDAQSGRISGAYGIRWDSPQQQATCLDRGQSYGAPTREKQSHVAPAWGCSCGIYAYQPTVFARQAPGMNSGSLLGQVVMWGRIVVATQGVRAQHARILRLLYYAPDHSAAHAFLTFTREWDVERAVVLSDGRNQHMSQAFAWLRDGEGEDGNYLWL